MRLVDIKQMDKAVGFEDKAQKLLPVAALFLIILYNVLSALLIQVDLMCVGGLIKFRLSV